MKMLTQRQTKNFYATSIFFSSITIRLCHLRACTDTWMKIIENTMSLLTAPIEALHKNQLLCICGIEAETQYRSVKARSLSFGDFESALVRKFMNSCPTVFFKENHPSHPC